jgi:hypothetical protein
MLISNIQDMERIVEEVPHLHWDGWDVIHIVQDDYAEYLPIGFYNRATKMWYRKEVYRPDKFGWEIPSAVMNK